MIGRLLLDSNQFRAGLAESSALAKAETTGMGTAFNGLAAVGKVALFGTAAAVGVIGVASVKMAADFETATNRLVTSAGEQAANIGQVRSGLLQMAGEVGNSAMDLASAYYVASSAGYTFAKGGLDVVRASAEGAKAEGADLKVVTDAVTSAMIDYHQPASAAAQVTTTLIAAVSQGKTTFQELTGSLHSVLPIASAAHLSLAEITADVASMTVHGMSADQATQNLAHTIQHLQTTTAPQNKELALLGLNARDLSNDLGSKGLAGTLQLISDRIRSDMGPSGQVILQMQTALKGLPPAVQAMGASVIDGSVSLGAFTKEAKGLSVEQAGLVHQFASLMTSTHGIGSAQQSGAQIVQTYAAALKAATGDSTTLNTALMLTGENAGYTNNAIKAVSGATTEAGDHVAGWASIQSTLNQHIDKWKYGLEAAAISLGTLLIPYVIQAMGAIEGLVGWLAKNQQVTIPLAVAIGTVLVVAIGAYTIAMIQAAIATIAATWPLLLVVAAVALVAAGLAILIMHWQQIRTWIVNVAAAISNAIMQHKALAIAILLLTGPVVWMIAAAALVITHWSQVVGFLGLLKTAVLGFFSEAISAAAKGWEEFSQKPIYWIGYLLVWIPVQLYHLLNHFIDWVDSMIVAAIEWGIRMAPAAGQAALKLASAFRDETGKLPGQMLQLGIDIVTGLVNGFKSMDSWLNGQVRDFFGGVVAGAKASLGISSPSTVMAELVGVPIAQGVALGITRGTPGVQGAFAGLVGGLSPSGYGGGASSAVSTSGSPTAPAGGYQIVFNLYGCTDPVATAAAVDSRLSRLLTST